MEGEVGTYIFADIPVLSMCPSLNEVHQVSKGVPTSSSPGAETFMLTQCKPQQISAVSASSHISK